MIIVILNDGSTWTNAKGCVVALIDDDKVNESIMDADQAIFNKDYKVLMEFKDDNENV